MNDPAAFWNERYAEPAFAYGEEPNDFVREMAPRLGPGPVLCLAEGQGRNAVFLAGRGHDVTAVDASAEGLRRAEELAARRGVRIRAVVADLADFDPGAERWGAVVSVFAHLPPDLRRAVHRRVVGALAPGGWLVLEAYTPRQLDYGTGGPPVAGPLMTLEGLREELAGLEIVLGEERERLVREGAYHDGLSHVVRVLARRPER